jgi:hypothetical protein
MTARLTRFNYLIAIVTLINLTIVTISGMGLLWNINTLLTVK